MNIPIQEWQSTSDYEQYRVLAILHPIEICLVAEKLKTFNDSGEEIIVIVKYISHRSEKESKFKCLLQHILN